MKLKVLLLILFSAIAIFAQEKSEGKENYRIVNKKHMPIGVTLTLNTFNSIELKIPLEVLSRGEKLVLVRSNHNLIQYLKAHSINYQAGFLHKKVLTKSFYYAKGNVPNNITTDNWKETNADAFFYSEGNVSTSGSYYTDGVVLNDGFNFYPAWFLCEVNWTDIPPGSVLYSLDVGWYGQASGIGTGPDLVISNFATGVVDHFNSSSDEGWHWQNEISTGVYTQEPGNSEIFLDAGVWVPASQNAQVAKIAAKMYYWTPGDITTSINGSYNYNINNIPANGQSYSGNVDNVGEQAFDWGSNTSQNWIHLAPQGGSLTSGSSEGISLTVDQNNSVDARDGSITIQNISNSNDDPETYWLHQAGQSPTLSVNPTSLSFSSDGGSQTVSVTSNTTWVVDNNILPDWLYVDPSSGSGNTPNVTIYCFSNPSTSNRTYDIPFKTTDGSISMPVHITQEGQSSTLSVSPNSLSFPSEGGTKTVSVTSNTTWLPVSVPNWITVDPPTTGSGNATVNITLGTNTSTSGRSGNVIFQTTDGSISKPVSVTQAGITQYTVSLSSNPSDGGTTTGGGTYNDGQSATVNAISNPGYEFVNWTENGNVVSSNSSYSFQVTSDRTLTANFSTNTYQIIVQPLPSEGGQVSGGGTYSYNMSATVNAISNPGYEFVNWTENGNVVSSDNPYNFTVTSDRNLVANFKLTIPEAPSNLTADLITWNNENVIKLTWHDNSNNEEGFKLERKVSGQWSTIANLSANTTTHDDQDIQSPYSQYEQYRISCFNSSGTSPTTQSGTITSVLSSLETPKEYKLSQNYPNPFNPTTVINYSIPKSSFVQIKVYDSRGSIVATLVNSTQSAGYYNVSFNAANLSSGIYLYSIKAGEYTKTMKMLLMK